MKKTKRLVALVLSLLIAVGGLPLTSALAEEAPVVVLATERAGIEGLDENGTYFTMGNAQTVTQERGRYALTIYRDGDTSMESSIQLRTVDVSATYGKDYVVEDDRYQTVVTPTEGTIIQRFGNEDYLEATRQAIADLEEATDALEEANQEQQAADEGEAQPQSDLAALKEAQTGNPTRATYDQADTVILPDFASAAFDVGEQVETSSYTVIPFAAGETEKTVIFRILEDEESEGQELINFMLSGPENGGVTEPFTTTILIQDDEPVVHPVVSFAAEEFVAEDGVATITLKRTEPLYSYVTAVVTTADDTARSGINYKNTQAMVEFLPYQDESTFTIDVAPGEEDTSFTVALSDLKGGDEGELLTTRVVIPGDGEGAATLMGMPDSVTLPNGTTYLLRDSGMSNRYYMYSETQPNENVGEYWDAKGFSYGKYGGYDTNSKESRYDDKKQCGYLRWYNWKVWNKGWSGAELTYHPDIFQSAFLDFESKSGDNDMKHGFETFYAGKQEWGGTNARAVRGPAIFWHSVTYQDGSQQQSERRPNANDGHADTATFRAYAERTTKELYEPEMWFYGAVFLYKQYKITVKTPDQIELKTPNGTRKAVPAAVTTQKKDVYLNGTVTFTTDVAAGETQRLGQLIGYEIQCGDGPNAKRINIYADPKNRDHYLSTDCSTITFTHNLVRLIENNTGKVQQRSDKNGYYTNLYIKPLFEKIPVRVDIIPADSNRAEFKSSYLKKSSTDQLFIGDEVSMEMAPTKASDPVILADYAMKQFRNPGDTAPVLSSDATNYQENKTVVFQNRRYEFKPIVTDLPNHIEVQLDDEAAKYFTVKNTFTGTGKLAGKLVLNTDETGTTQQYDPVAGKAYRIEVVPKSGVTVPAGYRPLITSVYNTNNYVNGYGMDIIAQAAFAQNRYRITVDTKGGEYQYFAVTGKAIYSSVALLDNSKPLTNQPAINNAVSAGAWLVDAHDKNGRAVKDVFHSSDITKTDGTFDVPGVRGMPGDRISVLIQNSNVDQVIYVKLNSSQTQSRTFQELSGWDAAQQVNTYAQVTKDCYVVSAGSAEMPVRTLYAPYVNTVTLRYSKKDLRSSSTVDIYEQDVLEVKASVEANKKGIHTVEFILYDKTGLNKGTIEPVRRNFNNTEDTKPGAYTYRGTKNGIYWTAGIPGSDLADGDTLYVRIIGEEKTSTGEFIAYPAMNVGVTFLTPAIDPLKQNMASDMSQAKGLGSLPLIGEMAGSMDSGNFMYKVTYADPSNMGRSSYIRTVGIAADIFSTDPVNGNNWAHTNQLKAMREGTATPAMPSYEQYAQEKLKNFNPTNEAATLDAHLVKAYEKRVEKKMFQDGDGPTSLSADEKKEIARDLYKQDAQKQSLNMLGGLKLGVSAKIMLQFEYAYDETLKEHVFVGGQWLVAGTLTVAKTFYWIVCGVPIFVDITGVVSLQVDGGFNAPKKDEGSQPITQEELDAESNVLDARFRPEGSVPWTTFTGMLKIQPGVGFCGILDAHGTLNLSLMIRWVYMSPDQYKAKAAQAGLTDAKSYGVMVDFSGGIGVTLLVVKIQFTLGSIKQGWGILDTDGPITGGPRLESDDGEEAESIGFTASLEPLETGVERDAQYDASLMSTLKQISTKKVREDTGEEVNPRAVMLNDNGDVFVVYMGSGEGRDAMNASTLKYMIRRGADGVYSAPLPVDDNGVADALPAILLDEEAGEAGVVYVAWTSAPTKIDTFNDLEDQEDSPATVKKVKDNLNKLEIYLRAYDVASGTWGETVRVTNDKQVDSDVRLVKEKDGIALYYFKRNLENINTAEDLVSVTQNYTSWAKKVYLPGTKQFAAQGTYAQDDNAGHKKGDPYYEKLIEFSHPTVQDPLVLDLQADGFTYQGKEGDPVGHYSFYLYSVDTDGKLDTSADRQIWLQVTNLDQNKTYYPILLDSDQKDVASPQLNSQGDELFITWVRNSSTLNLIDVRDFMDNLRNDPNGENTTYKQSVLGVFNNCTQAEANQRFWYRALAKRVMDNGAAETSIASKLMSDKFPIQSRDFGVGSTDDNNREENPVSGYLLFVGGDGNLYAFWTAPSTVLKDEQSILYASSYFKASDEWIDQYGDSTGNHTFSDPVMLSKTGVMIDELCAVVTPDSVALLLANTYERTYVEPVTAEDHKKDPFVNGPHSLSEFVFQPVGSLKVTDFEMSDEFPKANEEITFSWAVKNAGLLPAVGRSVLLQVYNGNNVIWKYEDVQKGNPLYVDETVNYATGAWKVPAGLNMNNVKVKLTVKELDANDSQLDEATVLERQLSQTADVVFREPYVQSFKDWSDMILDYLYADNANLTFDPRLVENPTQNDITSYLTALRDILQEEAPELLKIMEERPLILSDLFDYVAYVPVANLGNKSANLTAQVRFVDEDQKETQEVIGMTLESMKLDPRDPTQKASLTADGVVDVNQTTEYLTVPIKLSKKHFDGYGVARGTIDIYDGSQKVLEGISLTIDAQGVVDFTLKDANTVVEMKRGSTYRARVEAYPYNSLKEMVFLSTDPDVATVNQNGLVTAVGVGEATIVASELGSSKDHSFVVKVTQGQFPSECEKDATCPMADFTDVSRDRWYHDGIHWALENGVMAGVGYNRFAPGTATTRAMIVAMLYRLEGEPDSTYEMHFSDVPDGKWYTEAVRWAAENNIVSGYEDGTFGPNRTLTREQLASILQRYAEYQGLNTSAGEAAELEGYSDVKDISKWALPSFRWAVDANIIYGVGENRLSPKGSATRAQVAAMLMRYATTV